MKWKKYGKLLIENLNILDMCDFRSEAAELEQFEMLYNSEKLTKKVQMNEDNTKSKPIVKIVKEFLEQKNKKSFEQQVSTFYEEGNLEQNQQINVTIAIDNLKKDTVEELIQDDIESFEKSYIKANLSNYRETRSKKSYITLPDGNSTEINEYLDKYPNEYFKKEEIVEEPISESEEVIINISELADFYATEEIKTICGNFNPVEHEDLYSESYQKHIKYIQTFKRNKNG